MLFTKFQFNWSFGSGVEVNIDFQEYGGHLGFPIRTILPVLIYKSPDASYQFQSQLAFPFRSISENDLQDGGNSGHLGFLIETILAIFDLQAILTFPTKFQVNLPFGSGEEAKNRFSRWPPWPPSCAWNK